MRKTLLALLAVLLIALAPAASAHKTVYTEDGKVKITWGFLNEPAVTMTKNGLDLILTDNVTGAPIDGVSANTLKVEIHYGDDEHQFTDFGAQFGQHGRYTGVITPTMPGVYTLHLTGTINGTQLPADGLEIPGAHAVEDINDTYFPEYKAPSGGASDAQIKALSDRVAALEAKAKTQSETPSTVVSQTSPASATSKGTPGFEPVLVLVGLAAVALVLLRRRG